MQMKVIMFLGLASASYALILPQPLVSLPTQPSLQGSLQGPPSPRCRCAAPIARLPPEDALALGATAVILVGAGLLQLSVTAGERGIGAYLSKEKAQNPFYNYKSARRPRVRREDDDDA